MFLIHGIHKFRPRPVAFRLDYCRNCKGVQTLNRLRSVDFIHVYWIPLVPIGLWKRWSCSSCGESPYRATATSGVVKLLLMAVCLIVAGMFWLDVDSLGDTDPGFLLQMRLAFTAVSLITIIWVLRHKPDLSRKQGTALIPAGPVPICLICGGPMQRATPDHCKHCHCQHLPACPSD